MSFDTVLDKVINDIPVMDSSSDYWLVRSNSGKFYTDFNINNYVGIGWNEISLNDIQSTKNNTTKLKAILKEKMEIDEDKEPSENIYGSAAGQMLRFCNNIKLNDIVVVPSEKSELFLVGKVSSGVYEVSDNELGTNDEELNYKKSDYKKRIKVSWFGSFNRNQADSALYKMIYTHNTLSIVNDYRTFINRALFPYYIQDDKLYLSYQITESNDIQGMYLGQFVYQYSQINKIIDPDNRLDSKINVQSPGVVEFISESVKSGLLIFSLIAVGGATIYGGKVTIFGKEFSAPGILPSIQKYKKQKNDDNIDSEQKRLDNDQKRLDNDQKHLDTIKKACEIAKELGVPISTLGIELPEGLAEKIESNSKPQDGEN